MGDKKGNKVFVLGLDGATLDVMAPMMERGQLPTFAKIAADGVYGPLASVAPPLSPPAWVSFATGCRPGRHGVLGFTRMVPGSYKHHLVSGRDNKRPSIWGMASRAGRRVSVVNVPMTYPPSPINGLMVSGLDTPDLNAAFTYPDSLKKEIFTRVPNYRINLQLGGYLQSANRRLAALEMIHSDIEARHRLTDYLMEKYPWDFFVVKFNNPDIVQHHFWKFMDPAHPEYEANCPGAFRKAIAGVYRKLDQVASSLLARVGSENIFLVMSDHGGGARINKTVYLNEWLRSEGYLTWLSDTGRVETGIGARFGDAIRTRMNKPLSLLFRHTSPGVRIRLKNLVPGLFSKLSLHFKFSGWLSSIDWSLTKAFLAEQECVRINLKGTYPEGIVTPEDYETLRMRLVDGLKRLKDPDSGETVFEDVLTREKAFGTDADPALPDIQLITREAKYDISGSRAKERSSRNRYVRYEPGARAANGMHRPDGILFATGPGIRRGVELTGSRLIDLCPTILYALGLPVPSGVEGRVLKEAIDDGMLASRLLHYDTYEDVDDAGKTDESIYSSAEESQLMDNLRSLGYME